MLKHFILLLVGQAVSRRLPNPLPGLSIDYLDDDDLEEASLQVTLKRRETELNLSSLKYLAVITRHGSRSPTGTYPTDPYPYYDSKSWPDGAGQLTRYGKQQLYSSGQTLRRRYNGFLDINFYPNDTAVRANPYDRDFMSAACLLAGLYPPSGYQLWNPYILWQPIPIWTEPFDIAELASKPDLCPRFAEEQSKAIAKLDSQSYKYRQLLKYLSNHTQSLVTNIHEVYDLYDTLQMQSENGFRLPKWTKSVFPRAMAPLYAASFATMISGTPEMVRLAAGPVLAMVSEQLNDKANGEMSPDRKLFIEAAHDTTLQALYTAFGFKSPFLIQTSAFMVFELHQKSSDYVVQILYYNSSASTTPHIFDIPRCPNPCHLHRFTKMVRSLNPKNWKAECKSTSK